MWAVQVGDWGEVVVLKLHKLHWRLCFVFHNFCLLPLFHDNFVNVLSTKTYPRLKSVDQLDQFLLIFIARPHDLIKRHLRWLMYSHRKIQLLLGWCCWDPVLDKRLLHLWVPQRHRPVWSLGYGSPVFILRHLLLTIVYSLLRDVTVGDEPGGIEDLVPVI